MSEKQKPKVGDRVRVSASAPYYPGLEFVVTRVADQRRGSLYRTDASVDWYVENPACPGGVWGEYVTVVERADSPTPMAQLAEVGTIKDLAERYYRRAELREEQGDMASASALRRAGDNLLAAVSNVRNAVSVPEKNFSITPRGFRAGALYARAENISSEPRYSADEVIELLAQTWEEATAVTGYRKSNPWEKLV